MRKWLAALLVLTLTLLTALSAAHADGLIAVTVETVEGAKGDSVSVAVTVENAAGLDSLQFRVNYDPAALSLLEILYGDVTTGGILVTNTEQAGLAQVAYASAEGLTQDGVFLTLRFKLLTDAGSAVVLTDALASCVDADYVQTKAYLTVADGGVLPPSKQMVQALVTPWPVESPVPTPSPTPSPTPTPTPYRIETVGAQTPEPQTEAPPEPERTGLGASVGLIAAAAAVLAVIIVAIALVARRGKKRKHRKKR